MVTVPIYLENAVTADSNTRLFCEVLPGGYFQIRIVYFP